MISDIDQCSEPGYDCSGHGTCIDGIGTYECTCHPGFLVNTDVVNVGYEKIAACDFFLIQCLRNTKSAFLTNNIVVHDPS